MSKKPRVLIVDDDTQISLTLNDILSLLGYEVSTASTGGGAIENMEKNQFDCILSDIKMSGMNGVDLCKAIKQGHPDLPVILMTAYTHDDLCERGLQEGAANILQKPLKMDELLKLISTLTKKEHNGQ